MDDAIYNFFPVLADTLRKPYMAVKRGLAHLPLKFEHIFVAVITFPPILLCRCFYYQSVAYCVCFKMICKKSLLALFLRRYSLELQTPNFLCGLL